MALFDYLKALTECFPLSGQRRMRDSNPRGREPAFQLCKGLFATVHPRLLSVNPGRSITEERQRTMTTETRTETTLMIKSHGDATSKRHGDEAPPTGQPVRETGTTA